MANVKSIIASVENVRAKRVYASADITADEMGNAWLSVNIWNSHGMTTHETLALDVDGLNIEGEVNMFHALASAKRVITDSKGNVTATYKLADVVERVENRGFIYATGTACDIVNKLTNEVVHVMAEAIAAGNSYVGSCVRNGSMRGAFAALV